MRVMVSSVWLSIGFPPGLEPAAGKCYWVRQPTIEAHGPRASEPVRSETPRVLCLRTGRATDGWGRLKLRRERGNVMLFEL